MSILQQILQEMYVDPELLEQLGGEQRQILYRKMREEQVRRWRVREEEDQRGGRSRLSRRTPHKIDFLKGADGQPWVWVMGEHAADLPYEELVRRQEREELERERLRDMQDRKEAEELAKQEARSILELASKFGALNPSGRLSRLVTDGRASSPRESVAIASEEKASEPFLQPPTDVRNYVRTESQANIQESPMVGRKPSPAQAEEEVRKKTLMKKAMAVGRSKEEQRQYEQQRAEEIYMSLRRAKTVAQKRAEEMSRSVEAWWKESEEKARTIERTRKSSFIRAKEITKKTPDISEKILDQLPSEKKVEISRRLSQRGKSKPARPAPKPPQKKRASIVLPGTQPKSLSHARRWFRETEAPKGVGREKDGSVSVWFHGSLDRERAERLLEGRPVGSYLVRLSTKVWGYTISVKGYSACKHFLIDASSGEYCFMGPKQQSFRAITELLRFYKVNPITWAGQEVLLLPVSTDEENGLIFHGLFHEEREERELSAL